MTKKMKENYELGLAGKMDMIRLSVRAVTRGYKQSRLCSGCLDKDTKITLLVPDDIYEKIIKKRE